MKKNRIKRIREVASKLPISYEETGGFYKALKPINHENKIKRFLKNGNSVNDYVTWLERHNANMINKYPKTLKYTENK